ncbi:MAG: type II toxin-antitoxin system Phd/YefM family antitoxin [Salinisphaera sp.]|nr:type II toxin-antitoxin system Phd/YefM family antitoxin [Salinisphaera sp.]
MSASTKLPTFMTSREFNQNTSGAKKAAVRGPVFITDRGKPSYVLLTEEEYRHLTENPKTLLDALADPDSADIDFEQYLPKREVEPVRFTFDED